MREKEENLQKPLNALFYEIQQFKNLRMGSLIFKSHWINNAVSRKSTHYEKRSWDIVSVLLLKLLDILWGMGMLIESFVVQCLRAYLYVPD